MLNSYIKIKKRILELIGTKYVAKWKLEQCVGGGVEEELLIQLYFIKLWYRLILLLATKDCLKIWIRGVTFNFILFKKC